MVELMIVLAVMGVMASFGVPQFLSWRAGFNLKSDARDLLSHFQKAKLEAVKRRTDCVVEFDQAIDGVAYDYVVYVDDGATQSQYDDGEEIISNVIFHEDVKFDTSIDTGGGDGITFGANDTLFEPNGLPNDNGTVHLVNDLGDKLQIRLSLAGNIKIVKP